MQAMLPGAHVHPPLPGTHAVLSGTQPPLPGPVAALIGLAALAVVLIPFLWPLARQFNTMAHEGAHAIAASAMGLPLLGVTLKQNGDGMITYLSPRGGPRRILTSFAGYLGPSVFGLWAAKLIETGHVVTVLWIATLLLVLLLFLVRKSFGIISVPFAIAVLALVMRHAHDGSEEVTAYALAWLLLLSGARISVAHGADAGDAWTLAEITPLPRHFWSLLWIAATFLALIIGGKWLVLLS